MRISSGKMLASIVLGSLILLVINVQVFAGEDPPGWLKQAAAASLPGYDKNVSIAVLLKEEKVTVTDDGRIITVLRGAYKLLSREGYKEAVGIAYYNLDSEKVKDIHGWLIKPIGELKSYNKDQAIDSSLAADAVYDDSRVRYIAAPEDAGAGAVFGYECTVEKRALFNQLIFDFQEQAPVSLARFSLTLPVGWSSDSITFNHAKVDPSVSGSNYTWELHDLPPIVDEPARPQVTNIAPRLAISYFPAQNTKAETGKSFKSWQDVSRWLSELSDPQSATTPAIAAKSQTLVANAKTELEKIAAIARYVQSIQYISIQIGIGRGGGYRPHSAADVFTKSYGDCKDKANLMRAMLKAVGIISYPLAIYSGDHTYVRPEWPSPQQFNHCIIAIKVSDETKVSTIAEHPTLGRLLIFDPTDEITPVGDLPEYEQESFALLVAGDAGALLRMPINSPETNRLEYFSEIMLSPDGAITGKLQVKASGQTAVRERQELRLYSKADYNKKIETWIARGANTAKISKIETKDDESGKFNLNVEFDASRYGQLMQGRLLVFKPSVIFNRVLALPAQTARKLPLVLTSQVVHESGRIELPAGFEVDELPDAAKINTPFGAYEASYEVKDGYLYFNRRLTVQAGTVPAEQYTAVRSFIDKIRTSEQSPVVLVKK